MMRRVLVILPALLLVAGTAACGGGGPSGEEATSGAKAGAGGGSTNASAPGRIGDAASTGKDTEGGGSGGGNGSEGGAGGGGELVVPSAKPGEPGDVGSALPSDYTFTGKGGDAFCKEVSDLQASFAHSDDPDPSFADLAAQVAKVAPPPELEADWPTFVKVQESLAKAPQGEGPDTLDQATLVKFADASNKVSAYLTNVCGL